MVRRLNKSNKSNKSKNTKNARNTKVSKNTKVAKNTKNTPHGNVSTDMVSEINLNVVEYTRGDDTVRCKFIGKVTMDYFKGKDPVSIIGRSPITPAKNNSVEELARVQTETTEFKNKLMRMDDADCQSYEVDSLPGGNTDTYISKYEIDIAEYDDLPNAEAYRDLLHIGVLSTDRFDRMCAIPGFNFAATGMLPGALEDIAAARHLSMYLMVNEIVYAAVNRMDYSKLYSAMRITTHHQVLYHNMQKAFTRAIICMIRNNTIRQEGEFKVSKGLSYRVRDKTITWYKIYVNRRCIELRLVYINSRYHMALYDTHVQLRINHVLKQAKSQK